MSNAIKKDKDDQIRLSLFLLRLGVFVVMFVWTLDKFLNVDHAKAVFAKFYFLEGFEATAMHVLGALELLVILAFLVGFKKKVSYGIVLLLHAVSTLSSYKQYLNPFEGPNLLFFAAWPMLAACVALYLLRESDQLYSLSNGKNL